MQSATWFRKAAEQGDADAQEGLGWQYYSGKGVPQDYGQATVWSRKAAEQGNIDAQGALGQLCSAGKGVPQDYAEAYFWLSLAAARTKGKDREGFAKSRDEAAAKLGSTELSLVQQKAADWFAAHPEQP